MIGQGPPTGREGGAAVQLPFDADLHPAYGRVRSVSVEVLVVLAGVVTYFGIRGQTAGSREAAIDHAHDIVRLEQQLGPDHETQLQRYVIDSDALTTFLNWIYIGALMPVLMVVATIGTANHCLLDAIAGIAFALAGHAIALAVERRREARATFRALAAAATAVPLPRRACDDVVPRSRR
jgi:3-oxoacyl-(acyl-carrier-protein) synthase